MGSSSSRHRQNHRQNHHGHHRQSQNHQTPPFLPSSTTTPSQQVPLPSFSTTTTDTNSTGNVPTQNNAIPSSYSLTNTAPPSSPLPPPPPPLPPPPPPQQPSSYYIAANAPYASPMIPPNPAYNSYNHHHRPPLYPSLNNNGWAPFHYHHPGFMGPPQPPPPTQVGHYNSVPVLQPRYVDHNQAKTIKNDVNVHKGSIKVVADENNLDSHLVSFTFDAVVDGSITIFYFAKEGDNCTFTPVYPEIHMPKKIPFKKGVGQKISQPSGTGIDLGFFELDQLSKPSPSEDIFPLVIFAEACLPSVSSSTSQQPDKPLPTMSPHAQITQAVLEKNNEGHFQVKVIKQILWIDEHRYELREIYGIGNSDDTSFDDGDTGTECVICMTEPKDTAVLPCRHMCLCSGCAKELRSRSDRCPICRQPILELMEIKVNKSQPQ